MQGEVMAPRRRIVIFLRSLEGGGGAERVMLNLARAFADKGHDVDLVMARLSGRYLDDLPENVHLVDLRVGSALRLLPAMPRLSPGDCRALLPFVVNPDGPRVLGAVSALARHLRARRPDILLTALDYPNVTGLLARQLAGLDLPVVITVHNHLSTAVANSLRPRIRWLPGIVRRFFPRASAVVAVSRGVAEDAERMMGVAPGALETIYNPVIDDRLPALAAEPSGEPWLDRPGPPVVLGVGKLKPQKDFATLLGAFAELRKQREARLVILGEGPEEARLKALAGELGMAEDLRFPGFVANPFAYMARAGVFVLSSAWEGFGNVLVEAMGCGCPVVSTDCPSGPAEILDNGRFGRLVPVGDARAMSEAIGQALDDPGDAVARKQRAADFRVATSADAYLALFERLLVPERVP
jgi:glycosyltransferase involved in cell wall biosynthesis